MIRRADKQNIPTKKQRSKSLEKYRKDARKAARELFYDEETLISINSAKTEGDIQNALTYGRRRLEEECLL